MKIIITGAGDVGYHVAGMLADEDHDIVLIDELESRLQHAESHLDVSTLRGNAISIHNLEAAGVRGADLLIAATSSEETNITTAIIGKHLGAKRTIARISNPEFQVEREKINLADLGIDAMVFPEDLAAKEVYRLIKRANFTDTFEFGDGRLSLTGIILEEKATIVGKTVLELGRSDGGFPFTVVAIQRGDQTLIPRGETRFAAGDHMYVISLPEHLGMLMDLTGKEHYVIKNIMILGGSRIAGIFAKMAQNRYNVRIIERNYRRCEELAELLPNTLIIHGDGGNVQLLEEEAISEMDAFIALTGDSETNIMSCLVAKNRGVERTIALVENFAYISLSQTIGIDTLINKKLITVNNIFRYVRAGHVTALTSLHGVASEVLEFLVPENSRITAAPLKDLSGFPRAAVVGGVLRGKKSFIASGKTHIQAGDRVVVFSLPSCIHSVESFFN